MIPLASDLSVLRDRSEGRPFERSQVAKPAFFIGPHCDCGPCSSEVSRAIVAAVNKNRRALQAGHRRKFLTYFEKFCDLTRLGGNNQNARVLGLRPSTSQMGLCPVKL